MTNKLMSDISVSVNTPQGQVRSEKKSDGNKEEFMSLMAGNVAGLNVAAANNVQDEKQSGFSIQKDGAVESESRDSFNSSPKIEKVEKAEIVSKEDIETLKEEISSYEDAVKDIIKEEMDISEEELESAMETLGLTFVDLADPKNLAALIGELRDSDDNIDMLLDTSVKEVFTQINALSENLLEESGMDVEGLQALAQEEMPEVMPEVMPTETGELTRESAVPAVEVAPETETTDRPEATVSNTITRPVEEKAPETEEDILEVEKEVVDAIKNIVNSQETSKGGDTPSGNGNLQSQTTLQQTEQVTGKAEIKENDQAAFGINNTFTQNISATEAAPEVPVYSNVNTADVIEQIVTQARVSITEQVRAIQIELNPQNLGRLLMQVTESEGQVSARFVTQNESVKTALEGAISNLIQKLSDAGIKVDAVEVSVSTHEFEQNLEEQFAGQAREDLNDSQENSRQNSTGGINLGAPESVDMDSLTEEEALEASIMRTYGNTVNFRA